MSKTKTLIITILLILNIVFAINLFVIGDYTQFAKFYYKVRPADISDILKPTERFVQNLPFDKNKAPIVIMGCSFAWGLNLPKEETLAYKLQKISNRQVLNYAYPAHSVQHLLYKLQYSNLFNKDINPDFEPEYIVYVFIADHLSRMYRNYFNFFDSRKYLKYVKTKNGLEPDKNIYNVKLSDYIKVTCLGKDFNNFSYIKKSDDEKFNMLKEYLKQAKNIIDKKYKKTKLAVIVYRLKFEERGGYAFHTNRWNALEEEGIKVINFDTDEYNYLLEKEYQTFDVHPSGKAWDVLTPIIAKRLNLVDKN